MEITYKVGDFPDPGDHDIYKGIQEINKNNYQKALTYFEKASNYDNEYASLFVAIIYFTGFGLKKRNPTKAFDLFKTIASTWNNNVAQYILGMMSSEGDEGVPRNSKSGIYWLTLAADNNWIDAAVSLGAGYGCGESVIEDHKKAASYFEKVANSDKNEIKSIQDTNLYLFGNKNFKVNFTRVKQIIITDVQSSMNSKVVSPIQCVSLPNKLGMSHYEEFKQVLIWNLLVNTKSTSVNASQLCLATIYSVGTNNLPAIPTKAMYWAKKAAENNDGTACMTVGLFYERGTGVKQDYGEAMNWYKRSLVVGGEFESFYHIGSLYYNGKGVKKDISAALECFQIITHHCNHAESNFLIGEIYHLGKGGIPRDYKIAYENYHASFEYGYPRGATTIGILYREGLGVKKDLEKAYEWFSKGSSMNCPIGHYMLGNCYLNGYHAKIDIVKALFLFKRSYSEGFELAKDAIIQVETLLRCFSN